MKKLIFLAAVAAIGMVACNRIGDLVNNTDSSVSQNAPTNIMRFDSYEALSREIDRTLEMMSMSDRLMKAPGQGTNGFVSFGELADMAYENVAQYQDDYQSIEEVRAAVAQHSNYLQLVQDENGEYSVETKLYESPTRYIVNKDRMYQVKDTLVKTLEEYTILTPEQNYTELLSINETNIDNYLTNPSFVVFKERGNTSLGRKLYGEKSDKGGSDGRHRRLTALFEIVFITNQAGYQYILERCYMTIKSQRKDMWNVCWYNWGRPINYDVPLDIKTDAKTLNLLFKGGYDVWKIEKYYDFSYSGNSAYFTGISGYVQSPEFKITVFNPK